MKIDKSKLEKLKSMTDEELWQSILGIASANGIDLPKREPSKKEIEELRELLSHAERINPLTAMRMISNFKRGSKNE